VEHTASGSPSEHPAVCIRRHCEWGTIVTDSANDAVLNIAFSGQVTYYRAQSTVCQAIVDLAIEACGEWRKNLPQHSVITMDGSWSQRRNASHCVIHLIDVASGKIVDFEIFEKPIGFSDGNYFQRLSGRVIIRNGRGNQRSGRKVGGRRPRLRDK
jgi:hypothetical protein